MGKGKPTFIVRAALALTVVMLSACGGGGGSDTVSSSSGNTTTDTSIGGSAVAVVEREGSPTEVQAPTPVGTPDQTSLPPVTEAAAFRFLEQASFGPNTESVERVRQLGFRSYIDEQFAMPASTYAELLDDEGTPIVQERFFRNALTGKDQLRQRMAFALGKIFVVSIRNLGDRNAIVSYQRMLLSMALDNYYDILRAVTLHPSMGMYLNMVNNGAGKSPNENYAREVMQLFSIGVTKLNMDGSGTKGPVWQPG